MSDYIKKIAKSGQKKNLLAYLEEVKRQVADIRTEMKVPREVEREVRLAVCDVIDELLILPLERHSKERELPNYEFR